MIERGRAVDIKLDAVQRVEWNRDNCKRSPGAASLCCQREVVSPYPASEFEVRSLPSTAVLSLLRNVRFTMGNRRWHERANSSNGFESVRIPRARKIDARNQVQKEGMKTYFMVRHRAGSEIALSEILQDQT